MRVERVRWSTERGLRAATEYWAYQRTRDGGTIYSWGPTAAIAMVRVRRRYKRMKGSTDVQMR